jgi:nucleotide-binding universal stress UspA family protein
MFSMARILLPVDFSQRSLGAARYAEALANHYHSEATMLHVIPPPHYEFGAIEAGAVLGDLHATRMQQVRRQCEEFLRDELPEFHLRRVLLEGDPAHTTVDFAHNEKMDLIVMATHGYGRFRRFILGSMTAKVLHDADCPVWTGVHMEEAPPVEEIAFRTVAVGVDLGPQSEKTLTWAAQFACEQKARLVVVHATPSIEGRSGEYFDPEWRLHLAKEASRAIADLQDQVRSKAEVFIDAGEAPDVVCHAASTLGADLLVIGRGSAAGIFGRLRANAYSIIRQSPCPVVSV